ncbi:5-histidylcysteine sulfoxide synthase, partial [Sulfurimonas sp. MAG313]|nr:5-histidylcysteine sulfoxide synthase [Sulfurimonas sp. MAG313]
MGTLHTLPITLNGNSIEQKREEIREYFHKTFDLFEKLFECFQNDDVFYLKSEPSRHPIIFYFGHTATFFINKLITSNLIHERINAQYESMFAVGVDEMNWDDMDKKHYTWPKVEEVKKYRNEVRNKIDTLITHLPLSLPIKQDDPMWIILMGIEHERIHLETSSVLHRQLPIQSIKDTGFFPRCDDISSAPVNEMVPIEGAHIVLGKDKNHHLYGWDNEYGVKEVDVSSFKTSKYLVSNGEFLEFVLDNGYENKDFWDEEGLEFLKIKNVSSPAFWIKKTFGFRYRAMLEEMDMPLSWPVDVNYLEAKAFCKWKSQKDEKEYRLLTEAEWHRLYQRAGIMDVPEYDDRKANINFRYWASSSPVNKFPFGDLFDVMGNVWQWTESHMDAYEGFEVHPAYDDFSTPTFDGKHNILKGGSWASTGNELMKHSRYAFRRHFYQHAGFRYVIGNELEKEEENIYETDELVSQYCDFQYGQEHFGVQNFAVACAQKAIKYTKDIKQGSA